MLNFKCPQCHVALKVADDKAGQKGQCPKCRAPLVVPGVVASGVGSSTIAVPPSQPALPPLPAVQTLSRRFYIGSFVGAIVIVGICFVIIMQGAYRRDRTEVPLVGMASTCVVLLTMLYGTIVASILLYKLWAVIPRREARSTPGLAVALMFLPFFNIYWQSQAYWGWTRDFNDCMKRRSLSVTPAPEGLGLAICILVVGSNVLGLLGLLAMLAGSPSASAAMQGIAFLMGLPVTVLVIIFLNRAIDCVNSLAAALKARQPAPTEA
jgi:hypothetical protein